MNEFNGRLEAQRRILKVVNESSTQNEQLFALNLKAISRWGTANGHDSSAAVTRLLSEASSNVFAMANNSDDPIAGSYAISTKRLRVLEDQIRVELAKH